MKLTIDYVSKDAKTGGKREVLLPFSNEAQQALEMGQEIIEFFGRESSLIIKLENVKIFFLFFDQYLSVKDAREIHFVINLQIKGQLVKTHGIFRLAEEFRDVAGGAEGQLGVLTEVKEANCATEIALVLLRNLLHQMAIKYYKEDQEISNALEKLSQAANQRLVI